jgi:hypothetical protein
MLVDGADTGSTASDSHGKRQLLAKSHASHCMVYLLILLLRLR